MDDTFSTVADGGLQRGGTEGRIDLSSELASVPFELSSNLIYLTVAAGNARPMVFLLETGAGMTVIDEGAAGEMQLNVTGTLPVAGAGGNAMSMKLATASCLNLGGIALPSLPIGVTSFSGLCSRVGRPFDGLLGYDVLSRYVVELDYANRVVNFHDPERFRYTGSGETLPFTLECNALIHVVGTIVQAGLAPMPGRFVIDTGAGGRAGLILSSPFVEEHGLPGQGQQVLASGYAGRGLAGASKADIGRVEELQIGHFSVKDPVTVFSRDKEGFLSWPGRAGIIGNEILRRFRVTIDYPKAQIILEKNAHFGEPFEYDVSALKGVRELAGARLS